MRRCPSPGSGSASRSNRSGTAAAAENAGPGATTSARTWSSTRRRRSTARSPSTPPSAPSSPTPLPDAICDEAAALLEPLSVAITTMRKAGVDAGLVHPDRRRRPDRHHLRAGGQGVRGGRDHRHRSRRGTAGAGADLRRHPGRSTPSRSTSPPPVWTSTPSSTPAGRRARSSTASRPSARRDRRPGRPGHRQR